MGLFGFKIVVNGNGNDEIRGEDGSPTVQL